MKANGNRSQMIASSFKACSKNSYHKSEILPELLNLQSEMVKVAFPEMDDESRASLRLWDIVDRLEEASASKRGKGAAEIAEFKQSCKTVGNMIAAEISGKRGENVTFNRLEKAGFDGVAVRNIEVTRNDYRTEIDGVVLTSRGAVVVEVKNTRKNVFIDEEGNAYRTGKFTRLDCNLLGKMQARQEFVAETLAAAGYPNVEVSGVVVYTNDRIEIQNHCESINVSFLSRLPYLIKSLPCGESRGAKDLQQMALALEKASSHELYPMNLDMGVFKQQFAVAITSLDESEPKRPEIISRLMSVFSKARQTVSVSSVREPQLPASA